MHSCTVSWCYMTVYLTLSTGKEVVLMKQHALIKCGCSNGNAIISGLCKFFSQSQSAVMYYYSFLKMTVYFHSLSKIFLIHSHWTIISFISLKIPSEYVGLLVIFFYFWHFFFKKQLMLYLGMHSLQPCSMYMDTSRQMIVIMRSIIYAAYLIFISLFLLLVYSSVTLLFCVCVCAFQDKSFNVGFCVEPLLFRMCCT